MIGLWGWCCWLTGTIDTKQTLQQRVTVVSALGMMVALVCVLNWPEDLHAEIRLATPLGDHMVLQRNRELPLWGTAAVGERVTVTLDSETVTTTADASGNWSVRLKPREASSQPVTLVIEATNRIELSDILIGDVWLCSGQSNMHWPLRQAADGHSAVASANLPKLRLLNLRGEPYPTGRVFTPEEKNNCAPARFIKGQWAVSAPATVGDFSAVAFFFGRDLLAAQQIPIGLIHNAIGGTPTEAWVSRQTLAAHDELSGLSKDWFTNELVHPFCRQRALLNLLGPSATSAEGKPGLQHPYMPGFMYDSAIAPLAPFPLRGVLWYQGESNAHNPQLHDLLFAEMISDWRQAWHDSELPFLFVQLPNFASEAATAWPSMRESQRRALRHSHAFMAVTIDLGNPADVHPVEKQEVGRRLALIAREKVYGETVESSGPTIGEISLVGTELQLQFQHAAGGLLTRNKEPLTGFEVAGDDELFQPALAEIAGSLVKLRSPVPQPRWVRFSFSPNPSCYLVNLAGLPASPFLEPVK